jgi:hypothetical protein
MSDVSSLLEATRLFLRRHEEALASGEPLRGHEACTGLLEAIERTLPDEIAGFPDGDAREALARAVLLKRMSEVEGLALQLRLAFDGLAKREVDVLRLVALLTALRRTLRALDQALGLWAHEHGAPRAASVGAFDAIRAARECLLAGVPQAAAIALAPALRAALSEPLALPSDTPVEASLARWEDGEPRFDPDAARALEAALAAHVDDAVAAWALLDGVERLAHEAGMSPRPASR